MPAQGCEIIPIKYKPSMMLAELQTKMCGAANEEWAVGARSPKEAIERRRLRRILDG